MKRAIEHLQSVQQLITESNGPDWLDDDCEKLLFCDIAGLLHVEFYGVPWDESFVLFTNALTLPDVAVHIRSLVFRGPDEGANGTRNWNFRHLLGTARTFPNLTSLFIEPTAPDHHNQSIIAETYEENGQIAGLLTKAPRLQSLTVPSAPNARFFAGTAQPLRYLRLDVGYDAQNFVLNLSQSTCFPELQVLDVGEYNHRHVANWQAFTTPFDHYVALFTSTAFEPINRFILRNAVLSAEQLTELHRLRPTCQFMVVQTHAEYVRATRVRP